MDHWEDKYISVCKACGKLGESRGMFSWEILILDLLLDPIWWDLGLILHTHNLPCIVSEFIKAFIIEFSPYPRVGGGEQAKGKGGQMSLPALP